MGRLRDLGPAAHLFRTGGLIVCLSAAAAGCIAHIRGYGRTWVFGWGLVGTLLSTAPLAAAWAWTASRQAEVLRAPRVFRLRPDLIEFCGHETRLGGEGWHLSHVDVRLRPPVLLELTLARDRGDERESRTLWVPVPAGQEDVAIEFAATSATHFGRSRATA